MADQFSAKFYEQYSADQLKAEAVKLRVDLAGKSRNEQIDAVYNAELDRRHAARAAQVVTEQAVEVEPEAVDDDATEEVDVPVDDILEDEDEAVDFDNMTVAELRTYAQDYNIDLGGASRKVDIIDAIRAQTADDEEQD